MIPDEVKRSLSEPHDQSTFELSTAITLEKGQRKLAYATLQLVRKDFEQTQPDRNMDYGLLLLQRAHLSWGEGELLLDQLFGGQQLSLEALTKFSPFVAQNPNTQHFSSWAIYRNNRTWPVDLSEFTCQAASKAGTVNSMLNKPTLPLYPSGQEAIVEFFGLGRGQRYGFNDYGKLMVIVPDYRARIAEFKIGYEQVVLSATAGSVKPKDLRVKVYAASQTNAETSEDLELTNGTAKFSIGFDPTRVLAVLFDARDGSQIDSRDWYPGQANPAYAKVERPEQQIRDLIAAGEGKRIEFKGSVDNHNRDDFLETVIAFSNSDGGLILLGINDNGVPIGFKGDNDNLIKMIHDTCEPLIEPSFREYDLDGFPVLAVEIASGLDKPYLLKYRGVVYVRIGSNDVPASRLDLDQLRQGGGSGLNRPWNSVV